MDWLYTPNGSSKKRPILRHQIEEAQSQTHSASEAARYLRVSYPTYKKYATMYGLFENHKNVPGKGIHKPHIHDPRYSLPDILAGKHPTYDIAKLRRRLIAAGYLKEECYMCGFSEKRITDLKPPLMLVFKDGNSKNHALENMMMICFNCAFLSIGNLNRINVPLIKYVMEKENEETAPIYDNAPMTDEMKSGIEEAKKELNK